MNYAPVSRFVALAHLGLLLALLGPAMLALGQGDESFTAYLTGCLAALLVAALSIAMAQGTTLREPVRSGLRELLLSLLLFFTILPVTASIPFVVLGVTLEEGWFEAVSALTTTGGWLSEPLARASDAGMLYRSSLQWLGGLVSLATAAAVFVRPEFLGIAPLVPPFSRGTYDSYLRAFDRATWTFLPIYASLTGAGAVLLIFCGVPMIEAVSMALSLIATGGFVPIPGGPEVYGSSSMLVMCILMSLGAVNFVVLASFLLGRASRVRAGDDDETATYILLIPFIAIIFWISVGAGDVDRLLAQSFNAISVLSTNGMTVGETPSLTPVLVTAIIGGAAVSTAGGIKLLRWLVTMRRTGEELWRLAHPGAVARSEGTANELGIWIHTLAFTLLVGLLVLVVALYGHPLEVCAAAATAVIANAGPLLAMAPGTTADYALFDPTLRVMLGIGMIAGRLELVIVLVMLNRRFWLG